MTATLDRTGASAFESIYDAPPPSFFRRRWGGPVGDAFRLGLYALVAAFTFLLAHHDTVWATNMTDVPVYVVVAIGLNVLVGYTGQLSLGQWAFVGLGAITAANVAATGIRPADGVPFGLSFLAAAGVGAGAAVLLGLVALRITGLYLALVTLVFGTIVGDVILQIPDLNGNAAGVKANRPTFVLTTFSYYLFCAGIAAVVFLADRQLSASKAGRAMLAIKDNERVAQAFGVNVISVKLLAFAIAGGTAGLAGAMNVYSSRDFATQDYTGNTYTSHTLLFVVLVVVGGLGRRGGVVVAATFFALVNIGTEWVFQQFPGGENLYKMNSAYLPSLIGGILLLQTVIQNPGGIGQIIAPFAKFMAGGKLDLRHGGGDSGVAAVDGSATRA